MKFFSVAFFRNALIAVWALASTFLLLRAVIVEVAIQTASLTARKMIFSGTGGGSLERDEWVNAVISAPIREVRVALAEILLLALGFFIAFTAARRFTTWPRVYPLARAVVLVVAIAVATLLTAPKKQAPSSLPSGVSQSSNPLGPEKEPASSDRLTFKAFFSAPTRGFKLARLDGTPVSLPLDRPGRFMVLDFWASWCAPCTRSLPALLERVPELSEIAPVDFVVVSLDRSPVDAGRAQKVVGDTMRIVYTDGREWDHEIVREFRVTSIPHTVFVLPDGRNYPIDLASPAGARLAKQMMLDFVGKR